MNKQEQIQNLDDALRAAKTYFSDVRERQDLEMFASWIEAKKDLILAELDTCPKCELNPRKQAGGIPCEHCGMIGTLPWGG